MNFKFVIVDDERPSIDKLESYLKEELKIANEDIRRTHCPRENEKGSVTIDGQFEAIKQQLSKYWNSYDVFLIDECLLGADYDGGSRVVADNIKKMLFSQRPYIRDIEKMKKYVVFITDYRDVPGHLDATGIQKEHRGHFHKIVKPDKINRRRVLIERSTCGARLCRDVMEKKEAEAKCFEYECLKNLLTQFEKRAAK